MTIKEIKNIAKKLGIKASKMKKQELIRSIQTTEGNTPCYQDNINDCNQLDCCWRSDCLN